MSTFDNMTREEAISVLGLKGEFTADDVRKTYRKLCHQVHTDKGGTDALFRIVHKAYEILEDTDSSTKNTQNQTTNQNTQTNTGERRSHRQQSYTPPKREMSWEEVVRKRDFIVPFNTFSQIALSGTKETVRYNNYNVSITNENIRYNFVRSQFPLKITVKTWPSRWHALFSKPLHTDESTFMVNNGAPSEYDWHASLHFHSSLSAQVTTGYYEVTLNYLGREHTLKTKMDKSYQSKTLSKHDRLRGVTDIEIKLSVQLTATIQHQWTR